MPPQIEPSCQIVDECHMFLEDPMASLTIPLYSEISNATSRHPCYNLTSDSQCLCAKSPATTTATPASAVVPLLWRCLRLRRRRRRFSCVSSSSRWLCARHLCEIGVDIRQCVQKLVVIIELGVHCG